MPKYVARVELRKFVDVEIEVTSKDIAWDIASIDIYPQLDEMYPDLEIAETLMYSKEDYIEDYGEDNIVKMQTIDDVTYEDTEDGTVIGTILYSDGTCYQTEGDTVYEVNEDLRRELFT